jgi:hypothetical protein
MSRVGGNGNDWKPGPRGHRGDAGLQCSHPAGFGPGSLRKDDDLPPLAGGPLRLTHQMPHRPGLCRAIDQDHSRRPHQAAEERNARQLLFDHVAAPRQEREPDQCVER